MILSPDFLLPPATAFENSHRDHLAFLINIVIVVIIFERLVPTHLIANTNYPPLASIDNS